MYIITSSVLACLLWMVISIFDHVMTYPNEKALGFTWFLGPNPLRITVSEREAVNSAVTNSTNRIWAEDTDLVDSKITFQLIVSKDNILGVHYFGIKRFDSKSIDVFIRNSLMEGYRTIDTYQIRVVAYGASKRMNNAYKDVILTILRNEGVPKWTQFQDTVSMREDTLPYEAIVAQVNAVDNLDNVAIQACDDGIPPRCIQRLMTVNVSKDHFPPQFSTDGFSFIMTENEAAGFQIGKIISTDSQPLGQTVYELVDAPDYFEVNRTSGQLILKKSLRNDYDVEYKFRVRAFDTGEPFYVSTANVTVVTLRNIFGPRFVSPSYSKTVHETFPVGGTLFIANATDPERDTLIFSLSAGPDDTDFFYIEPNTGIVKLAKSLSNQTKTKIEFFVQVRDQRCVNEKNATAAVIINVQVDLKPPYFVSSTDIPPLKDTAQFVDVVHTFLAIDDDLRGSIEYELVGQSPAQYMFTVNLLTGVVTLIRDILGSGITLQTYTVEAYDSFYPDKKARQTVTVNVTMGEGTPVCQAKDTYHHYQANEYVPPESLVGKLFAQGSDGDTPIYSLVGDRNDTAYVYTDPTTGVVKRTQSLRNPPKTNLTIIMTVQMVKGHYLPPVDADPFVFFMGENEGAGYNIGTIAFKRTNGALLYELVYAPKFFELNGSSGQLSLKESLRTDFASVYEFGVRAYDASKPKRINVANANVTVNVFRNDNVPRFSLQAYQKTVPETFPVGQLVLDADATDVDGDTLEYSLVGNPNDTDLFYIVPSTGAIYLAKSLVNPPKTRFKFSVEARDQRCVNEGKATVPVTITVQVDSAPDFVSSTDIPPLKDTAKLGDEVHTLVANDNNLGGNMTYKLVGRSPALYLFSVNSITGVITLARDILGSGLSGFSNYTLDVEAYDSLYPNKKATQTLYVNVTMSSGAPEHKLYANYRFQENNTTLNKLHKHVLTIEQLLKPYISDMHNNKN